MLAARFMPARLAVEDRFYRIRVRDLVLMANIGVYEQEHEAPQRVRINLELKVLRAGDPAADDIADVLSYDSLIAGIRRIVDAGHINLIETLADDIAALCLSDSRVVHATVGVDKLDVEPAAEAVGVEIERSRETDNERNKGGMVGGRHFGPMAVSAGAPPWVVKLGGSLAHSPVLKDWIGALAAAGGRGVVVPGGGPFADRVREMQNEWEFGDAAADAMAVLAMDQYGHMLAALDPRLHAGEGPADFERAWRNGGIAVWLPRRMTREAADIPASWDVTSDSLAAWLAGRLGARRLILVKQAELPQGQASAAELGGLGVVDPMFGRFLAAAGDVPAWCVHASRHDALAELLGEDAAAGTRILAA